MASSSNKDWDADFCCDLAELMVSSEEEEVVSAGVPTELRVSLDYFSWLWAFSFAVLKNINVVEKKILKIMNIYYLVLRTSVSILKQLGAVH